MLLPIVELVVGVLLLIPATTWLASVAAAGLFICFAAFVSASLVTGNGGDCRCFGNLSASQLSGRTVARNLLLLGTVGIPLSRGPKYVHESLGSIAERLGDDPALTVMWLLLLLVGGLVFVQFQVLRQQGRIILRLDEMQRSISGASDATSMTKGRSKLDVGSEAPLFVGRDVYGAPRSLTALRESQKPLILVFLDAACGSCRDLLPEVTRWRRDHSHLCTVVVVARSNARDDPDFRGTDPALLVIQEDREISELYGSFGTPSAVAVDVQGQILAPLVYGSERIREMLRLVIATNVNLDQTSMPRAAIR